MALTEASPRSRFGLIDTLQVGSFRRLWFGTLAFGSAQQMEMLILGWWILEVTNNPLLVGLMGGFRFWPSLLGPFGGVVADRFDRRAVLLAVQGLTAVAGVLILVLAATGRLEVWHTFALTLVNGSARTIDNATRQAAIGDLLPRERLINGLALHQMASNGTAILAPVIGGILYNRLGLTSGFAALAGLYVLGVAFTWSLPPLPIGAGKVVGSAWGKLIEGLDFVRRDQVIAALMLIAAIANLCGYTLTFGMLPVFARDVLGTNTEGLGLMTSAVGAGSLLGGLTLGSLRSVGHRGRFVVAMMVSWMAVLVLFGLSRSFPVSLALLALNGATATLSMSTVAAMLMDATPVALRGRVMGVRGFVIVTLPVATTAAGALTVAIGAPLTLILMAGLGGALTGLTVVRLPGLWRRA
ncbi:MAG TPA: MFS transporter [Dehalococcoidia bacterium]|nr:MFS transporter [Dehalococcoidia bacterium]